MSRVSVRGSLGTAAQPSKSMPALARKSSPLPCTQRRDIDVGRNALGELEEGSPRKRVRLRTSSPAPDQSLGETPGRAPDPPASAAAAAAGARLGSAGSTGSAPGDGPGPAPGSGHAYGAACGAASPSGAAGEATPTSFARPAPTGETETAPGALGGASGCRPRGRAAHAAEPGATHGGGACAGPSPQGSQVGDAAGVEALGSPKGSGRLPEALGLVSGPGSGEAGGVPGSPGPAASACAELVHVLGGSGGAGSSPRCMQPDAGRAGPDARRVGEVGDAQLGASGADLCASTTSEGFIDMHVPAASAPAEPGSVHMPEAGARRPAGLEARSATRDQMLRELLRVTRGGEEG